MVEFYGDASAINQVLKGLYVVDIGQTKILCNCCVENVEKIEFINASFVPERTCKLRESYGIDVELNPFDGWACDRCKIIVSHNPDKPNYCPNCGARVIE